MAGGSNIGVRANNLTQQPQQAPVQCAFVLEDDPSVRVTWDSFPTEGIIEGYNAAWKIPQNKGIAPQPFFRQYEGGDWDLINMQITFHSGVVAEEPRTPELLETRLSNLEKRVRLIQAMAFPKPKERRPSDKKALLGTPPRPPFVLMIIGDFVTYRGLLQTVQLSWQHPFHPVSARPYICVVNVGFQPLEAFYPDYFDVQEVTFRGSVPDVSSPATPASSKLDRAIARRQKQTQAGIRAQISAIDAERTNPNTSEERAAELREQKNELIRQDIELNKANGTPISSNQ